MSRGVVFVAIFLSSCGPGEPYPDSDVTVTSGEESEDTACGAGTEGCPCLLRPGLDANGNPIEIPSCLYSELACVEGVCE